MKKFKILLYPISLIYGLLVSIRNILFDIGILDSKVYKIPTIGIGAGKKCDGQILVTEDLLGLTPSPHPSFVKNYSNLRSTIKKSINSYKNEVKKNKFP